VKEALDELSDEEIMRDEDPPDTPSTKSAPTTAPPCSCNDDEHGSAIRHRGQLDRILEESEELWIVPADVHF